MSPSTVRIAVAGAGLIGLRHIEEIAANPRCTLASIVDVSPKAADVARNYGVSLHRTLEACLAAKPDGVVLAITTDGTVRPVALVPLLTALTSVEGGLVQRGDNGALLRVELPN